MASSSMALYTWILIGVYAAVTLFFVVRGALKIKNINDYAVGNITFHPAAVGLAFSAAMTSTATFVINPGLIANYGISAVISYAVVMPLAALVSLIVLSKRFRKHGTSVKALTMAQWMGTRYKSKYFALFFAFTSLLLLAFIVLICVGLVKVLSPALNVSELSVLLGVVIFIFGYMMFGGANSMVYTNMIQAGFMLIVTLILLTSGYQHFSGGVHAFLDKLAAIDQNLVKPYNVSSPLFRDFYEIYIAQIIIGVAIVCQPHTITKVLLVKTDKGVNQYLTVAVIAKIFFFSVVAIGLYARLSFPDLMYMGKKLGVDGVIPAYVVKEFPVYMGLIVLMGLISSGFASLEGLIQSVSTTITVDLLPVVAPFLFPKDEERKGKVTIAINKIVIAIVGVVAIILSYQQIVSPKISVAIFAQNGVYAYFASAFVPILFGMFLPEAKIKAVFASSVVAIVTHMIMYYGNLKVPFSVATGSNPGVAASVAIILSLTTGLIIYFIERRSK